MPIRGTWKVPRWMVVNHGGCLGYVVSGDAVEATMHSMAAAFKLLAEIGDAVVQRDADGPAPNA